MSKKIWKVTDHYKFHSPDDPIDKWPDSRIRTENMNSNLDYIYKREDIRKFVEDRRYYPMEMMWWNESNKHDFGDRGEMLEIIDLMIEMNLPLRRINFTLRDDRKGAKEYFHHFNFWAMNKSSFENFNQLLLYRGNIMEMPSDFKSEHIEMNLESFQEFHYKISYYDKKEGLKKGHTLEDLADIRWCKMLKTFEGEVVD